MESDLALLALAALAHQGRLDVFCALVREGDDGLPAGQIATELGIPASTLSFHLKQLEAAGLIASEREGRMLRYTICPHAVQELFWFLGEECCQGRAELCPPPTYRIQSDLEEAREQGTSVERTRVLFLGSRNSTRSQLGEAILRHIAADRFEVRSAGIRAHRVHPRTLEVLAESGIDGTGLYAKDLSDFLGKGPIDVAIVVCERAQRHCERVYPFARELLFWPAQDPEVSGDTDLVAETARFRDLRDAIWRHLEVWSQEQSAGSGIDRA